MSEVWCLPVDQEEFLVYDGDLSSNASHLLVSHPIISHSHEEGGKAGELGLVFLK